MNDKLIRNIAIFSTAFAMVVVVLGAFTRLVDAGLGCPDWPGCYGFMHIPMNELTIQKANMSFPEQPYELAKAWPEMVHRYFAGTLGVLVLALAIFSWKNKEKFALKHSTFLLILIIFQAALGMWTVTMKLHPVIVMLHLMGGITTFSLLASLSLRYHYRFKQLSTSFDFKKLKFLTFFVFIIIVAQVALGGWTSANYAAMVCLELPICQGDWITHADFSSGFQLWLDKAETYEYGVLDQDARIAIHVAHRIGAIIATISLLFLIFKLLKNTAREAKLFAYLLLGLLITQVTLGVNNIVFHLPLANAVAHNAVGALLVVTMTCLITLLFAKNNNQELPNND